MGQLTTDRRGGVWFESHASEWIGAGLISPDQIEAIRYFEHLDEHDVPHRFTLLSEAAAYLGCVLALLGGAAVVAPNWNDLALLGQLVVAAAVTLVGFLAGAWLVRLGESGTMRLGSFLWVVGTGGLAMTAAIVVAEIDPSDQAWFALIVGLPVLFAGLLLWRNRDRPLQLLTAAVGAGLILGGVGGLTSAPAWVIGLALLAIGVGFTTVAEFHRLEPRLVALATGSFGAYVGALVLTDANEHLGAALALLVALGVVALALSDRLVPLLVLGVIGSLIATQTLLVTTFTGPIASMMIALVGLVIVAVTIVRTQHTSSTS